MQRFILLILTIAAVPQQTLFAQLPQSVYVQRMMSLDKNRDGFLAADELPGKLKEQLKVNDTDADGRLSPQELASMEATAKAARDSKSHNGQPSGGGRKSGPQGRARRNSEGIAGTGLDPAQILRFALTFDANRDGALDAEELRKYSIGMAARRAGIRGVQGSNHQSGRTRTSPSQNSEPATPASVKPAKGLSADGKGDGGFGE